MEEEKGDKPNGRKFDSESLIEEQNADKPNGRRVNG